MEYHRRRHGEHVTAGVVFCGHCPDSRYGYLGCGRLHSHIVSQHNYKQQQNEVGISQENTGRVAIVKSRVQGNKDTEEGRVSIAVEQQGRVQYINSEGKVLTEEDIDAIVNRESGIYPSCQEVTCRTCNEKFPSSFEYKKHNDAKHSNIKKRIRRSELESQAPLMCQFCSKRFYYIGNFENHLNGHAISQLHCDRCNLKLPNAKLMRDHLKECRKAEAENRLSCPVCKKVLSCMPSLKYHMRTHGVVRRIACTCGRRFTTNEDMKKHVRLVHLGPRQYPCPVCPHRFTTADLAKRHYRAVHLNKKLNVCKVCKKGFSKALSLKQHSWVHTGIKQHSCPHCSRTYSDGGHLKRHIKKFHVDQQTQEYEEYETELQGITRPSEA